MNDEEAKQLIQKRSGKMRHDASCVTDEAKIFYEQFCATPGYSLRLREDGQIGVGVPERVSNAEFALIQEQVWAHGDALVQVLKDRQKEQVS